MSHHLDLLSATNHWSQTNPTGDRICGQVKLPNCEQRDSCFMFYKRTTETSRTGGNIAEILQAVYQQMLETPEETMLQTRWIWWSISTVTALSFHLIYLEISRWFTSDGTESWGCWSSSRSSNQRFLWPETQRRESYLCIPTEVDISAAEEVVQSSEPLKAHQTGNV